MWTAFFSAFWLGILTAVSPCPLATNIAAISFIGRKAGNKKHVIGSGLLYSAGRTIAYVLLGIFITAGILASDRISRFLQKYMNEAIGPVMILLGLVLLGWIGKEVSFQIGSQTMQKKAEAGGLFWAFPIGFMFALSFCPVSAGLFFGALLPLALNFDSSYMIPIVYGIGTSLPVVIFAILIGYGSSLVGKAFNKVTRVEVWVRTSAGVIFIFAGLYYCLRYIYGVSI